MTPRHDLVIIEIENEELLCYVLVTPRAAVTFDSFSFLFEKESHSEMSVELDEVKLMPLVEMFVDIE